MFRRILVCIDGSPASGNALVAAMRLAELRGGRLRLLHVLEHPASFGADHAQHILELARTQAREPLRRALEVADAAEVEADTRMVDGAGERLGEVVAREAGAWAADLIVVGSHGRQGVQRALLGSGAEQVVRLGPVPVLVVRGPP